MKLAIGSAQFGLDYGISNNQGKVPFSEAQRILEFARASKITLIDTAPIYGDSEAVLGKILRGDADFHLVTKTPPIDNKDISKACDAIEETFKQSLVRLQIKSAYALLIHRAEDIFSLGGERLVHKLKELKRNKLAQKIGVSVYNGEQIDRVLEFFQPDIIQLPINIFDQRLVKSGHLAKLYKLGIEIHARSIFLQGLLLMDPKAFDPFFTSVYTHFRHYKEFVEREGLTPLEMALQFIFNRPEISNILVGVTTAAELGKIVEAYEKKTKTRREWSTFAIDDEKIINPSLWKLHQ